MIILFQGKEYLNSPDLQMCVVSGRFEWSISGCLSFFQTLAVINHTAVSTSICNYILDTLLSILLNISSEGGLLDHMTMHFFLILHKL